ncbi:MAG: hypothetical protein ACK56I_06055, partial [bacterium]
MGFGAILPQGRAENTGRIELVATQLGHQSAPRAGEQSPADQLLDRRPHPSTFQFGRNITAFLRIDLAILKPGGPLSNLLLQQVDVDVAPALQRLVQFGSVSVQLAQDAIDLLSLDHLLD